MPTNSTYSYVFLAPWWVQRFGQSGGVRLRNGHPVIPNSVRAQTKRKRGRSCRAVGVREHSWGFAAAKRKFFLLAFHITNGVRL